MKKRIVSLLLLISLCAGGIAQELEVLDTRVPEGIKFAQPFTLQMFLSHPENADVETDKEAFPKDFEITGVSVEKRLSTGTLVSITAIPFTIKQSTFTATFVVPDGEKSVKLTKEIPLTVEKVQVFNDDKFRDIRMPKAPFNWLLWLILLLAVMLIVGSIIYANRAKLAAGKWSRSAQITDNRPADEIALSQIDALISSGIWEKQQYKVFYLSMSDILREYILRMFSIDVSADTSAELLRRLKSLPQFAPLLTAMRTLLASGDLVKFARAVPSLQIRDRDIVLLRELIKQTAPKTTPQEQEKTL